MEPVLEVEHLTLAIKGRTALADLSFDVLPGEIRALAGEEGAGKTSLMKVLAGLHPSGSYHGQVKVGGRPVVLGSPLDALRAGISVVQRRSGVFERLSVAENILMGQWQTQRGILVRRAEMALQAREVLARIGLKLEPNAPARGLTMVQQRLLCLARAISNNPKVVVLDEPTTYLGSGAEIASLFLALRTVCEQGIALLYLARRADEAMNIADRITVLRDGTANGTWLRSEFDELTVAKAMLSQRMGGAPHVDHDDEEAPGGVLGYLRSLFFRGDRGD